MSTQQWQTQASDLYTHCVLDASGHPRYPTMTQEAPTVNSRNLTTTLGFPRAPGCQHQLPEASLGTT